MNGQSTPWLALLRFRNRSPPSCLTTRLATPFHRGTANGERDMANGTVKWFNTTKGFGFIMPSDGGKDVFVHITAVQAAGLRGLNDGQAVTYEVVMERGKAAATNLKLV
jgi:CspA family cold shock protein